MHSHFRLKLLAAAISMAAAVAVPAAATGTVAGSNAFVTLATQHVNPLRNGDVANGPVAFSQPMQIVVSLNFRNQSQLDSFVAKAQQPGTPVAQRSMTPAQFAAQFSPTEAQAQAVASYLTKAGFTNVSIAPNRLLVTADATADSVGAAFHTTFEGVRTHTGRNAYHNTSDVMIPSSLQGIVRSVVGLDTVHMSHTFARRIYPGGVHPLATGGTAVGHNPTDFPKIYSASSLAAATSITVGNIVSGQMSDVLSDVKSFESTNGLTSLVPSVEGTGNKGKVSQSGDTEWDLDAQDIIAMSGGLKGLILYDAASLSDTALTTDYNLAVTDDTAKVINVSLGECETDAKSAGTTTAEDAVFEQAVAQGQTFSVSAGDSGANECTSGTTPSWPASSQYVVAMGGTEVYTTNTTTWTSETVWNNLNEDEGATGGSPSKFEPIPSWQKGVGQNGSSKYRGVPDIAFEGSPDSGALIIVDGQSGVQVGGTSLASPLFVGSWARIEQANGGSLGFAAPLLYSAAAANYAADFHDITSGNNSGETATTGWDYTTGWGSLIVSQLASNISSSGGGGGSTGGAPTANFSDTTTGLTASFTDSSTDAGGTISAYAWTFGDGGTATTADPSHTYAAAGTYSVTETVTDSVSGATSEKTGSVTVTSGGGGGTPTQLLGNTGFETGTASPWTMSSGSLCTSASCGSSESPHAGSWFAWLDGYGTSHTDTVSQSVTIPAGTTTATLQYYLHIDTTKTSAVDKLTVQVLNSSGTVLATVGSFTNLNKNAGYAVETANLSAYIGQKVTVKFTGVETKSRGNTDFTLDDVTLTAQ